jgi:alanyl-tRNA synthetase
MNSNEIRTKFLDYFVARGHAVLPSASLVPDGDPTVLFTTAGMQPLVPYLLGEVHPLGTRLASVQKCLRTVDIDEVGDNRHDTFFEMLGNWSLGDYFKNESIAWSWTFLTSATEGLGLDPKRLYVTVFAGDADASRDDESIGLWQASYKEAGIDALVDVPIADGGHIFTMAKDSNWWGPAGTSGPCGPDTEIYYDLGDGHGNQLLPDGFPDFESGRIMEIWNNVFMQYNKDQYGHFQPLGKNNVDTGMGLERIAMVVQNAPTVFETDLFAPIIDVLKRVLPEDVHANLHSLRIVADHLRSSVMLISDGVFPSNKDRGYILRRLIRRAILHSGLDSAEWVAEVVRAICGIYARQYPDIASQQDATTKTVQDEAAKFYKTVRRGMVEIAAREHLSGKDAFDLYQTFGFPLELTKEYAQKQGVTIDDAEFEAEFARHQNLSRTASAGQFKSGLADHGEITVRYHTATHLLHQALKDVLGSHVQQKGSNITPERLRFDFAQPEKLTPEQVAAVEKIVNRQITADLKVSVEAMSPAAAKELGAIGLFGDKYGDSVTVYSIGAYSKEICTGPHVSTTGELGHFKIAKEEAVSAGVRRIKAVLE